MKQYLHPENLDISRIDFADFSYAIAPSGNSHPDKSLTDSIARHGIIHPPVVRETTPGSYAIVTGRKRLRALSTLFPQEKSTVCLIFSKQLPEVEVFSFLLEETTAGREFTPVEKAIFLQKVSLLSDDKYIAANFLIRMGILPNPAQIRQKTMLLDLEEVIIQSLHRGDLHESVARDFLSLSANDRLAVYGVIASLRLGMNYQKKLLNICRELSVREDRPIFSLLHDPEVREILEHRDANPPQKTKNLMNLLTRKHKPRSSRADEEFNRFVASLQLPGNISVAPTPSFEDDAITLAIKFSNKNSLEKSLIRIKNAVQDQVN